jgi:hypothetical protein
MFTHLDFVHSFSMYSAWNETEWNWMKHRLSFWSQCILNSPWLNGEYCGVCSSWSVSKCKVSWVQDFRLHESKISDEQIKRLFMQRSFGFYHQFEYNRLGPWQNTSLARMKGQNWLFNPVHESNRSTAYTSQPSYYLAKAPVLISISLREKNIFQISTCSEGVK